MDRVKVRWKEGKRHRHGDCDLDKRYDMDGDIWVPVRWDRTGDVFHLPAWQCEYAGSGPRGGRRWLPLSELAFDSVTPTDEWAPMWTQMDLFGEAA